MIVDIRIKCNANVSNNKHLKSQAFNHKEEYLFILINIGIKSQF
mgnify:CR=1 FL=1